MAKTKQPVTEREYIINLRSEIHKVPRYRRTPKAVKAVKEFIAQHMRVPDRDLKKVKLSKWLNQELWFRGIQNPITKVKVKAKKEGDNIIVDLAEYPDKIKFAIAREEKSKKTAEKIKSEKKKEEPEKKESTAEEKKEEKEKEEAVKEAEKEMSKTKAKEQKHLTKPKHTKTERMVRKTMPAG